MKRTTFRVTEEHIEFGIQRTKGTCAIALAITEADDDLQRPRIDTEKNVICVSDIYEDVRYEWDMPTPLRSWANRWDEDKEAVEPITFVLDPKFARVKERTHVNPVKAAQYKQRALSNSNVTPKGSYSRRTPYREVA
jgi:hypothetical protein